MSNLMDTILNIGVFVFIGITLWLYFKEVPEVEDVEEQKDA